jgi:hypothetical protein
MCCGEAAYFCHRAADLGLGEILQDEDHNF